MKKRTLCLFTALCLTASLAAPALAADADTKLETIRVLGILSGDGNGNLNLGNAVTRAEFVTMMTAASPYKDTVGASNGSALFKDVKTGHWASGYIRLAVEQGWVSGYVDGSFRPGNTITLEEACTALLRMLGYDSGALAGSFPSAQLSKASAIGLLDDLDVKQGQKLTRQECVGLFYNALLAETSGGQVYGTTLGYTITNDELDWPTLVNKNTKGPYVAQSGAVSLPFSTSGVTVYRNGTASSLSAVKQYDVYYYNESLRTVWVYSDRITGTLTDVSPNTAAPTAVTVAGNRYDLGTSTVVYQFSSQGSFRTGDTVTLLLGKDGEVVSAISAAQNSEDTTYYGVVVASAKSASSSNTTSADSTSIQTATQVACTDGVLRTFYHSGSTWSAGRIVSVDTDGSTSRLKNLSKATLEGRFSSDGSTFAGYRLAADVQILDTDSTGGYARIYPSRLAGSDLSSGDVLYYSLNGSGEIDRLILNRATGDTMDYIYLTRAASETGGMSVSGSYTYYLDGQSQTISGSTAYSVSIGGAMLVYKDGAVNNIKQLQSVSLTSLSDLYAMSNNRKYLLDEDVQVLLKDDSTSNGYYVTKLADINDDDYRLTGWYDDFGYAAGGRIRIIVAAPN